MEQNAQLTGICMSPTNLVPLYPAFMLKEKFQQVANKFMQMGKPPKSPDTKFAMANTLD